jgi:ankyrin repeat protein
MTAVKGQHDRIVEYLLKQGADPFVQDHENRIASELVSQHNTIYPIVKDFELLFAVLNNNLVTTETVIAEGALVNFRGVGGYTSLMVAAEQNYPEMVELLILHGADPTLTLANGQNAINLTADSRVFNLLEEAQNWGKEIKSTLKKYPYRFFTVKQ